ncbi:hypothetical protein GCM10010094_94220 [Streptomyces flaveus]|uniref:Uncharacterized protein n=1 Tax=Streptomyces flaveus TaxID=66370 RepID=A0A917RQ05_9ACTN|nr:hypothetical protein GCM10010094_94220 [Streptomyces flaveus]
MQRLHHHMRQSLEAGLWIPGRSLFRHGFHTLPCPAPAASFQHWTTRTISGQRGGDPARPERAEHHKRRPRAPVWTTKHPRVSDA